MTAPGHPALTTFDSPDAAEAWLEERQLAREEMIQIADTLSAMSERLRALAAG